MFFQFAQVLKQDKSQSCDGGWGEEKPRAFQCLGQFAVKAGLQLQCSRMGDYTTCGSPLTNYCSAGNGVHRTYTNWRVCSSSCRRGGGGGLPWFIFKCCSLAPRGQFWDLLHTAPQQVPAGPAPATHALSHSIAHSYISGLSFSTALPCPFPCSLSSLPQVTARKPVSQAVPLREAT